MVSRIAGASGVHGRDARQLAPLTLAYIGDTVFDLFVRTEAVLATDLTARGLHGYSSKRVCAAAQAGAYSRIEHMLTEDELYIAKRGRNAHMGSVPKHALIQDYRTATALEALIGYLYLTGQDARLCELASYMLKQEE